MTSSSRFYRKRTRHRLLSGLDHCKDLVLCSADAGTNDPTQRQGPSGWHTVQVTNTQPGIDCTTRFDRLMHV